MSNSADPAATADFVYESISGGARVRIRARFMTEREMIRHERIWNDVKTLLMNDEKLLKGIDEMLSIGIVSPPIDELKGSLSRRDLQYLAVHYPDKIDDVEIELGKSRSRPQFTREPYADDVAVTPAIIDPASSAIPPTPAAQSCRVSQMPWRRMRCVRHVGINAYHDDA